MRAISRAAPIRGRAPMLVPGGGLSGNLHPLPHAHVVVVLLTNIASGTSRPLVGLKDHALAEVPHHMGVTLADATAVRLAEIPTRLAAHAARLELGARNLPAEINHTGALVRRTPRRAQTPARVVVPFRRRPRASDFRKCYPALAWLPAVRRKIGSALAASPSTANLPCSASVCFRQINYVWTAD